MTHIRIWLLIAALVGGAAFVACGGSSTNDKTKTPTPVTTSTGPTSESNTPSATSSNGTTSLSDLVNNAGTKTIKATYTFTASGTPVTFTIYNKPPDWRFDVTEDGDTTTYISAGGKDYICSQPDQTCTASPVALSSALPFVGFFTNPQTLSGFAGTGANHSTKTVAGEDADCYSASAQGETGEVCFNHDGILVSLSGGGLTMEATEVSGTVADSDLTPPYPVQ